MRELQSADFLRQASKNTWLQLFQCSASRSVRKNWFRDDSFLK